MIPVLSTVSEFILAEWTSILIAFSVIVLVCTILRVYSLPPGPTLIPYVGCIPGYVGEFTGKYVAEMCKKYNSDIISMRQYGQLIVFLNSHDLIKETFALRTDVADRYSNGWAIVNGEHRGITVHSGPLWKHTKRTLHELMRNLGMTGENAENFMIEESEHIIKHFSKTNGEAFDPSESIRGAMSSIICQFLFAKRFDYDDKELASCMFNLGEVNKVIWGPFASFALSQSNPIGRWIYRDTVKQLEGHYRAFTSIANREVEEHGKTFDNSTNDLIGGFLHEMHNGLDKYGFDEKHLKNVISDLMEAGIEGPAVVSLWMIMTLMIYPKMQEKIYEELILATGHERHANLNDKKNTPYTEAFLYELLRVNILLDFGLFQCCLDQHLKIKGYTIPKGTPIAGNYWWLSNDPKIWKNPTEFDPNNFLQNGKVVNQEKIASFSIGRRSCPGEKMGKLLLYIFLVTVVKSFKLEIPEGTKPDFEPYPYTPYPKPFTVKMIPRK